MVPAQSYYHSVFENRASDGVPDSEPLLIDGLNPEQYYTFEWLKRDVLTLSAVLRDDEDFSVQRGDAIALYSPNDVDFMVAMHGVMAAGGIAVVIPIECQASQEVADICKQAQPTLAVVHTSTLHTMREALAACGMPSLKLVTIGKDAAHDPSQGVYALCKLIEQPRDAEAMVMDPEEIAYTFCTSGTTGARKLAAISHRVAALRLPPLRCSPTAGKIKCFLPCAPISLILGNATVNLSIQQRVRAIICKSPLPFDTLCAFVEKYKVEYLQASLWVLLELANNPVADRYDLSTLKRIVSGGQHVPDAVLQTVKARLNVHVISAYGSTECWTVTSKSSSDKVPEECEGARYGGCQVRIVDEDGKDVGINQPGELWVKTPLQASMYYNNPKASAKAFRKDGYYRTGDYFTVDGEGNYRYWGRESDRIRTKGKTFPPLLVEDLCLQYSDKIRACCVVGALSKQRGYELPRAYVVRVDHSDQSEEQQQAFLDGLVAFVNDRVPQAEMRLVGGAKCLSKLPLSKSDKVDRRALRRQAEAEVD